MTDPHKGVRLLMLDENNTAIRNSRYQAKIALIESCLESMKYERKASLVTDSKLWGWVLKNYEATYTRITKENLENYKGIPVYKSLEEIESSEQINTVKTVSIAKKFGL